MTISFDQVKLAALSLALGGCVLIGIEPDDIDNADESGEAADGIDGGSDTGVEEQGGDGDGDPTSTGDGDGDPTSTGDGDGDPSTGDGDPSTGDGDGDGDDNETGDGDPVRDTPCSDFGPEGLIDGPNPIEVPDAPNTFAGECGGADGPDAIFSYTATVDGLFSFALSDATFDGVVYLVGDLCVPLDEWVCDAALVETLLTVDQTVYIIVDSNEPGLGGSATLTITGP
jgi:hypothetical protein